MKTVYITNLGCKVNQYESQALRKSFKEKGWQVVSVPDAADACVINTCSVTSIADRKSRQIIRQCRTKSPDAVIAVTGCYVQTGTESVCEMDEVDAVIGTNRKKTIPDCVENIINERNRLSGDKGEGGEGSVPQRKDVLSYEEISGFEEVGPVVAMEGRTRAFIKVQEGCNRFCSYCIIPYARGNMRSRAAASIIEEAKLLISRGYKEIVLTGINTALYGAEVDGKSKIHEILSELNALSGDFRIRLSSLEPTVINAEYIKELFGYERLCHHVHLSLQSGSDSVLKAMNRLYTREEYLNIVKVIKEFDENYGITTDIIVGFPGEKEEDFLDTVKIMYEVDYCRVHGFKFSARKGTEAADMEKNAVLRIAPDKKHDRITELTKAAEESSRRFIQKNTGTQRVVLFEEVVDTENGKMFTGFTDNYIKAYLPAGETLRYGNGSEIVNTFQRVSLDQPLLDGILCSLL